MRKSPLLPPFPGSALLQTSLSKPCCRLHAVPSARRVGRAVGCGFSLLLLSSHSSPLLCHGFSTVCGAFKKVLLQRELSTGCGGDLLHLGAPLPQPHPPPTPVFLMLFLALFSSSFLWGVLLCFLLYSQWCHDLGTGAHSGGTAGMGQPLASSHRGHPTSAALAASTLPRTPNTRCGIWVVTGFWFPSNNL